MSAARCQLREQAHPDTDSRLVLHAARADGRPQCGIPVRPWHGRPMVAAAIGPGEITCRRPGCCPAG